MGRRRPAPGSLPGLAGLQAAELLELLRRVRRASFRGIGLRELVAGARGIRIDGDRLLEKAQRGGAVPLTDLDGGQTVEGLDGIGVASEGLLELDLRLREVALAQPRPADEEVRAGMAGLQAKTRLGPPSRQGELALPLIGARQQEQGLAAPRLQLDEPLERFHRLRVGASLVGRLVDPAERLFVRGIGLKHRPERLLRLLVAARGEECSGNLAWKRPVLRIGLRELPVGGNRGLVVLRLQTEGRPQLSCRAVLRRAQQEGLDVPPRVGPSPEPPLHRREPEVRLGRLRVELDRACELPPRVLEPLETRVAAAEQRMDRGRLRSDAHRVLEHAVGLEHPVARAQEVRHPDEGGQVVPVEPEGRPELDEGVLRPARTHVVLGRGEVAFGRVGDRLRDRATGAHRREGGRDRGGARPPSPGLRPRGHGAVGRSPCSS